MKIQNIPYYFNLRFIDLVKLFVNYPYYQYLINRGTRFYEKNVHNYKLLLDLYDKGISRELILLGTREIEHILFLKNELKAGMTVLDIGANIGYYSVMMGKLVGEKGVIYSVEPALSNIQLLDLNVRLNKLENIVSTFHMGISNISGNGEFYESEKANWHTFYPKVHSGTTTESLVDKSPVSTPVMTIPDFIADKKPIDLIRMDVEGFEVEIFDGMKSLLENMKFKAKILFEVHQPRYNEELHDMKSQLKRLFDAGYYVKKLASNLYDRGGKDDFFKRGYIPESIIKTDYMKRGIFNKITNTDAIELICETDYVRTVLLERI